MEPTPDAPSTYLKLRPLDLRWVEHQGGQYLLLRDPLGLAEQSLLVPASLVPLLALLDGTRDATAIRNVAMLRTGVYVSPTQLDQFLRRLDDALCFDNARFREAQVAALEAYRQAPHRPPALAGGVYPADPQELEQALRAYCELARNGDGGARAVSSSGRTVGILSPHIDYARGGPVYGGVWERAEEAVQEAGLVVVLGTDHAGGPGRLTLTRQPYATPWGVLPTDAGLMDALTEAIGPDNAFAEEVHHLREHSVEMAAVWLHYALRGRAAPVVPVLYGSMEPYVRGQADPAQDETFGRALAVLARALEERRGLVVIAGDLAHVGPAFGGSPLDPTGKARLAAADRETLGIIGSGDAEGFFANVRQDGDARNYCGLTPIYLALRLMGRVRGELTGYSVCPADEQETSVVTVAGMLFNRVG